MIRSATLAISSRPKTPTIWSTSGTSSRSISRWRSARHPATMTPLIRPSRLRSSISRITPSDSWRAESMKPQVLMMTRSAAFESGTKA